MTALRNYLALVTVIGPVSCVSISQVQISILTVTETWGEFLLIEHPSGIGVTEVTHLTKIKPVICGPFLSCPEQHHYLRAGIPDHLTSAQETCPAGPPKATSLRNRCLGRVRGQPLKGQTCIYWHVIFCTEWSPRCRRQDIP